jgi:hypothetical protein
LLLYICFCQQFKCCCKIVPDKYLISCSDTWVNWHRAWLWDPKWRRDLFVWAKLVDALLRYFNFICYLLVTTLRFGNMITHKSSLSCRLTRWLCKQMLVLSPVLNGNLLAWVWKSWAPPKVIVWQLLQDRLRTRQNLFMRRVILNI